MIRESKKTLARLLATEDITVRQIDAKTASFDTAHRILYLPKWKFEETCLLDRYISHEVAHALMTPDEIWQHVLELSKKVRLFYKVFNILEDARIERLIQVRYPGLIRTYKESSQVMIDKDIMKVSRVNVDKLSFKNRINIHAKLHGLFDVAFSDEEAEFYSRVRKAETPEEILELTKEYFKRFYAPKNRPPQPPEPKDCPPPKNDEDEGNCSGDDKNEDPQPGEGDESSDEEENSDKDGDTITVPDTDDKEEGDEEGGSGEGEDESDEDGEEGNQGGDGANDDFDVKDYGDEDDGDEDYDPNALDDFQQDNVEDTKFSEFYVPNDCRLLEHVTDLNTLNELRRPWDNQEREKVAEQLKTFRTKEKPKVSFMISEFNRRKAAWEYSRGRESSSGSLNMNKIHRYKVDDDIFLRTFQKADAKSHGMVMIVDYSVSMKHVMQQTIEQLIIQCMFCDGVGIPYEVYGFTNTEHIKNKIDDYAQDELCFNNNFHDHNGVFQLLDSTLPKVKKEEAFLRLYGGVVSRQMSFMESLGGTPLDHTIIASAAIVRRFQKKTRVQKTNLIFLTDGDNGCRFHTPMYAFGKVNGLADKNHTLIWEDHAIKNGGRRQDMTEKLFGILRKILKNTVVINYRLATNCSFGWSAAKCNLDPKDRSKAKKDGVGYKAGGMNCDHYFLMHVDALDLKDSVFGNEYRDYVVDIEDKDAMKNLRKAFKDGSASKKVSRLFARKFTEVIA